MRPRTWRQLPLRVVGSFDVPHPELIKIGFTSKKTLFVFEIRDHSSSKGTSKPIENGRCTCCGLSHGAYVVLDYYQLAIEVGDTLICLGSAQRRDRARNKGLTAARAVKGISKLFDIAGIVHTLGDECIEGAIALVPLIHQPVVGSLCDLCGITCSAGHTLEVSRGIGFRTSSSYERLLLGLVERERLKISARSACSGVKIKAVIC